MALALSALMGCATVHRPRGAQPIPAVSATTAEDAWSALIARRATLTSIQAYLRIHATVGQTSRSFRATLSHDSGRRTLVEALTPLGTAAFTIFSNGSEAIFIDHLNRKFWRGPATSVAGIAGDLVPTVDLAELALLATGLPIDSTVPARRCESCGAEASRIVMQQGEVRYTVGSAGLAGAVVERGGERLTIDYSPASFPPSTINVERYTAESPSPVQSLQIQILDLVSGPAAVQPPVIPGDYSCCAGR